MAGACRKFLAALLYLALAVDGRAAGMQVLHGHVPPAAAGQPPVGRLPEAQHLQLAIVLPLRNQGAINDLLRQLYDPASPRYRQYLKKGEAAAQFGPTQQDYDAVAAFARAHNLKVTRRYDNRLLLDVDGTVSDIENALHVTMRVYRHPSEHRTFYAPDTEPSLDLAVPIAHIAGLDNFSIPKPRFDFTPAGVQAPNGGSGPGGNYMGNDFRAAYVPGVALTGSGQSVALLQFDGYSLSDIQTYESQAGLPNVTCTNVLLDGFNGTPASTNGQLEVSLDIEMVISMAPGVSRVILYEGGPNGIWYDLLNQIQVDDAASQVSCSWYSPGQPENPTADGIFQLMATQGQSFYCASGDNDAYTGLLPFPEDTPYITEVGGTTLTTTGGGGSWVSETAWNWNNGTGTGGGISTQYQIPVWQTSILMNANAGSMTMRNTPDVALTANDVYVYAGGKEYSVGGTSCASPLWAGFTALVNQEAVANGSNTVGFINRAVYTLANSSAYSAVFHDITTGNNTSTSSPNQFYATPGYDLCTGLGTPAGAALINALALPADSLQLTYGSLVATGGTGGPFTTGTSFTISNTGATPLAWTAGATQSWLSLSATSGTIATSGSTTIAVAINANADVLASGSYYDTISFTDPATGYIQTRPVGLTVVAAPVITSALTATATSGSAFSYQIAASNTPASYAASGLPSGLSVNTTTGVISGTPSVTGTSFITISAVNIGGTGTATLALTILPPRPVISSPTSATAIQGASFTYDITATHTPTSYGASGLPLNLSVNTTTGVISGTATATGTDNVTISASNAGGTGTATLVLTVHPPVPVITSSTNATGTKGSAFTYQITATNSPTKYAASGLPSGLTVSTSSGAITGTPSATGTSNVAISAVNVTGTGTATLVLVVLPPPPVITSGTTATATTGAAFTYQIAATNSPTSFGANGLPSGLGVNASGLISGTATATGTSNVTISAINAGGTGSATLVLTVLPPPPVITSATNAMAVKGSPFTYQITATNSPTGYGASGLPSGLTVNSSGLISGTPTATGASNVSISATNAGGIGSATLALIVEPPPPVITSGTNATATMGSPFTYQITATNGPTSFSASGLPAGLSVDPVMGIISGTATTTGTSDVTISAANITGTGSATLVLVVLPPPPVITSGSNAMATEGSPFSYQITATNNPASYGASGLPAGLTVNSFGLISGTPTATGTSDISISATNAGGTGNATLALIVLPPPPVITSGSAATATVGVPFSYQITATNGPTSFGAAGLPPGLSVDPVMGVISGTATATGTSNVTITAANVSGTGSAILFLNVLPPAPVVTSGTSATATQGVLFTYQITATNNPTSYAATGLPPGLTVDPVMGIISGTATATGTSNITISAVNLGGTGSAILALSVLPPPPIITSGASATVTEGQPFSYQITATNGPTSYAACGLPAGLMVDPIMGIISGTATASGTSNIVISAMNLGGTGSAILVLSVIPPPPVITSGTSALATEGEPFTYQITATNGPTAYMASGLPAGLNIDPSTGLISGTATATVARNVTIAAVNVGGTGSASLALLVETPYAAWQNAMFTQAQLADPTISGDSASPAGDGIPNLLKYALNLNPLVNGDSGLPIGSVVTTGSGSYLTLTYPLVLSATDITYTVQVSTDLINWNSGPGYTDPPTPIGNSDGVTQTYNVQAAVPAGSAPQQYIRLQVTGP
jgi:hypothetical protein